MTLRRKHSGFANEAGSAVVVVIAVAFVAIVGFAVFSGYIFGREANPDVVQLQGTPTAVGTEATFCAAAAKWWDENNALPRKTTPLGNGVQTEPMSLADSGALTSRNLTALAASAPPEILEPAKRLSELFPRLDSKRLDNTQYTEAEIAELSAAFEPVDGYYVDHCDSGGLPDL